MGILKEKPEKIDTLYMSWGFDEADYAEFELGFNTLTPEMGPSIHMYDYDVGKNSSDKILTDMGFHDKNFFEMFTNDFSNKPYRI